MYALERDAANPRAMPSNCTAYPSVWWPVSVRVTLRETRLDTVYIYI